MFSATLVHIFEIIIAPIKLKSISLIIIFIIMVIKMVKTGKYKQKEIMCQYTIPHRRVPLPRMPLNNGNKLYFKQVERSSGYVTVNFKKHLHCLPVTKTNIRCISLCGRSHRCTLTVFIFKTLILNFIQNH